MTDLRSLPPLAAWRALVAVRRMSPDDASAARSLGVSLRQWYRLLARYRCRYCRGDGCPQCDGTGAAGGTPVL